MKNVYAKKSVYKQNVLPLFLNLLFSLFLSLLLSLSYGCVSEKTDDEVKLEVFNQTWELINTHYYLPDFGGLNWQKVKIEYEAKIIDAKWPEEAYSLLIEMVAKLNDGHSRFLPQPMISIINSNTGVPGMIINRAEAGFIIVKTVMGGSAEEAGVTEGSTILAVDGIDVTGFWHGPQLRSKLVGEEGTFMQLDYQTPDGIKKSVQLQRRAIDVFANAVTVDQSIENNILYLEISNFVYESVPEDVTQILSRQFNQNKPSGIILDLRKNIGGNIEPMTNTAALFKQEQTVIGTFIGRESQTDVILPNFADLPELKEVPLVLLVGPNTQSAAEIFAHCLKENERAILIGQTTRGNVEGTDMAQLPDGSRLSIASKAYTSAGGFQIDGHGIEPDLFIANGDYRNMVLKDDPVIQAAVDWVKTLGE